MSNPEVKGYANRIVPAPMASDPRLSSTILDVVCGENDEIEWHWTMTVQGRFVSGYSIVQRTGNFDALGRAEDATPSPGDAHGQSRHGSRRLLRPRGPAPRLLQLKEAPQCRPRTSLSRS